jgi:TolA-binding protein
LSSELGFDREGLTTLNSFVSGSKYYQEAQDIMADMLNRTKDYDQAIRIIENIKNPSLRLKEAYQMIAYNRALQLIQSDRPQEAKVFLQKAIEPSYDRGIQLSAQYWQGDVAHRLQDYNESIEWTGQFISQAGTGKELKNPDLIPMAYYLQGFNYLKKTDYTKAGENFKQAVDRLNKLPMAKESALLADALLRGADCSFKRNRYDEAIGGYNQVIKNKYAGYDYALYQTAIIQGLKGNVREKTRMLDDLAKRMPTSKYADESLYELGVTYTQQSEMQDADAVMKKMIKDYPSSNMYNRGLIQLGLISYNLDNKNDALRYYKEVFKHNPSASESQEALTAIQEIYVDDLGQADEYIRFIESIPGYNLTNYSRDSLNFSVASRYFEDGQYERAVVSFSDYLQKFPNGVNTIPALFKRGESYTLLKKYDQALNDYEAVIKKGRNDFYDKSLFKSATLAYNHSQDFTKAFKYYAELSKSNVDDATLFEAQLGAMRSAYRTGLTHEVLQYGEKVANNPQSDNEQKSTSNFYLGKIAYDQKEYTKANTYLNTAINLSDNIQTAEARYLVANILFILRQNDQAEKSVRSAIQLNSDHPYWVAKCLILLSDIFVEKSDLFNAKAALEAVLENYKDDPEITRNAQDKLAAVNKKQQNTNKLKPDSLRVNSFFENN